MTDYIFMDSETYCEVPIKSGTYRYAEACETDILTFAVGDEPVVNLDIAIDGPGEFVDALERYPEMPVVAHNAMFDRTTMRLGKLKLDIPIRRWRCAMVKAYAHALPGSLEKLGEVLGIDQDKRKMKRGHELMMLFCKPRPKNHKLRRATRTTHPKEWAEYRDYASQDTVALREIWHATPSWNYGETGIGRVELDLWHRDQKANDRGYLIDLDLAHAAVAAVEEEQVRLSRCVADMTDNAVEAATQRDKMLEYLLLQHGMVLADLTKATVSRLLEDDDLPKEVRMLLLLRQQASQTSTAKYGAVIKGVSADGRLRGTVQMNGASRTRRAAGRLFQPQNLPSRDLPPPAEIEFLIAAIKAGAIGMI